MDTPTRIPITLRADIFFLDISHQQNMIATRGSSLGKMPLITSFTTTVASELPVWICKMVLMLT